MTKRPLMKKMLVGLGVCFFLLIAGSYVVVNGISFKVAGYRSFNKRLDDAHLREMEGRFDYAYDTNEGQLRQFALRNTAFELDFDMHTNALQNPNAILDRKSGHCKTYSYVVAATYNQMAKRKNIKGSCRVAYGYVYLYGVNLHQFFKSSFFRNHDFCVITDRNGVRAADAILFDYALIDQIRLRK